MDEQRLFNAENAECSENGKVIVPFVSVQFHFLILKNKIDGIPIPSILFFNIKKLLEKISY